ncbi:hypothetical protein Pan44_26610 [Caulifigura coniformis]|uniref:Transcriptional regulator PadR-like family protein n=1 Tax=Caulifigura coniformis TaxID=2527983 RepID=A0A517SER6_9PLAN|nr:hypothetical protein [Caulifigura coniformis]QDT54626.1 hypothetical protein Pan44_26610 [Caulifigura coniformis]
MPVTLPQISPVQFIVLKQLQPKERTGKQIREVLDKWRKPTTLVSFYLAMARLEEMELVSSRLQAIRVANVACRERAYKLTAAGRSAVRNAIAFYALKR